MTTCFWHRSPAPGNMGDVVTPVLLTRMGRPVSWAPKGRADMIAAGSIVGAAGPGTIVWGSGAMAQSTRPHPEATYLAVRGPLTRELVLHAGGECSEVYGDPAMLLPSVHDRPVEKAHDWGVVPHYVDLDRVRAMELDAPIISPLRADPLDVVDDIRSCRLIVSSSLHGLIVAEAYGIPWAWVPSAGLKGDNTKFRDFAASVGVDLEPSPSFRCPVFHIGAFDAEPLRNALRGAAVAPSAA